jgi:hypothetical protein
MWSPTKLDFLFYDFSVIYYDFSKIQQKYIEKEKVKTVVTVVKPWLLWQNCRRKLLQGVI